MKNADFSSPEAWRAALHERQAALAASGLPVCDWMDSFEKSSPSEQSKRLKEIQAHQGCELCAARDAFIAERFPPMPPAPRPGVLAVVIPIAERISALPRWAQAPATGAILFIAYSLFKILLSVPSLARSGWGGLLTAAEGIAASGAIGAIVGFIYDLYRRRRDAASTPEKKAALAILDGQMAELRATGVGGGALQDAYLRQRRAVIKGELTAADLQAGSEAALPVSPDKHGAGSR